MPKRKPVAYRVSALDIETASDGSVLAIGMGWLADSGEYLYRAWETWDAWYDGMLTILRDASKSERSRLSRIYAHNGASFDWLSLVIWARDTHRLGFVRVITSGSVGIGMDIEIDGIALQLRDSIRLLPGSLASLAASFGVPTQKQDVAKPYLSRMEVMKEKYPAEFWSYLRSDVLALSETVTRFWELVNEHSFGFSSLPMTLPGMAVQLWRETIESPITTSSGKLREFERRGYTGGRTECYRAIVADVRIYDANSLYPTVMERGIYPTSNRGGWVAGYHGKHGLYAIDYEQGDRTYPPVLRDEASGEFMYVGSGVYCQPEIEELLRRGGTITCTRGYVYRDMGPLFQPFIRTWYGLRKSARDRGDDGLAYVCKILMNSLYGKFGQRDSGETIYFWDQETFTAELHAIDAGQSRKSNVRDFGDFVVVDEPMHSEYTFVAVAAYVTAYARLELYEKMCRVIDDGGTLYATDTDSVHAGGYTMATGGELGEWKEEYAGRVAYLGRKLYAKESGEIKAKGIGKSGRESLTFSDFCDIINRDGSRRVEFETMPTIRETLGDVYTPNAMIHRHRIIRATARGYDDLQ